MVETMTIQGISNKNLVKYEMLDTLVNEYLGLKEYDVKRIKLFLTYNIFK